MRRKTRVFCHHKIKIIDFKLGGGGVTQFITTSHATCHQHQNDILQNGECLYNVSSIVVYNVCTESCCIGWWWLVVGCNWAFGWCHNDALWSILIVVLKWYVYWVMLKLFCCFSLMRCGLSFFFMNWIIIHSYNAAKCWR